MRLIDADALINRIVFHTDWSADEKEAFEDEINVEPTIEPEWKWIPCSERLPDKYGAYIVTYKTDETDIATFDPDRLNKYNGAWSACDANGFYWLKNKGLEVIAWMPLPEPFREEGENE